MIHLARKLRAPDADPRLRYLQDRTTGKVFCYLKDAFEYGRFSQVFVGVADDGEVRIFKRVSCLPSKTPHGLRAIVEEEKRLRAGASTTAGADHSGTMPYPAAVAELVAVRAQRSQFARDTVLLQTTRSTPAGDQVSKFIQVMPPAPTDILGCVHALETQSAGMRYGLMHTVLEQVAQQLCQMHRSHCAHGDVRSENILCDASAGTTQVQLWDFGSVIDDAECGPFIRKDVFDLGKICLMLLAPHLRESLEGDDLARSLEEVCAAYPDAALQSILRGMLHSDPSQRWGAADVLHTLRRDLPPREHRQVDAFVATVRPLARAMAKKLAVLADVLPE